MRNKGAIILIFCLSALGLSLFLTDFWLGLRNSRYNWLIEEYECGYLPEHPCKGDFDGDGRLTHIELRRHHDALVELPPQFAGNKEEGVLNIFSLDNTLRTHVGVRSESGRARLIIYDGSRVAGAEAHGQRCIRLARRQMVGDERQQRLIRRSFQPWRLVMTRVPFTNG